LAEAPEPEPEPTDDESPVETGRSARAEPEASAHDEFPPEEAAKQESAGLTPAPEEAPQAPAAKSPKSARATDSASSPQERSSHPSKLKSIWGMAAIAAGVLGAVAALISPARVAAIPLGSAGLLLAIAGIYFSLKRKRSGLLLPAIGTLVCLAAISFAIYIGFHNHRDEAAAPPTAQELADRARAARIAQANIGVQFIGIRPAPATAAPADRDTRKYDITFAYKCLATGMSVPRLVGQLRISDASGKEIETLTVFESFPLGLGTTPVQREGRWSLTPATAQLLQGDASQLKVEFDPS